MEMSRTGIRVMMRRLGATLIIFIIIGYAIFRALDYARGPVITIHAPTDGLATSSEIININGQALRVSTVSLNGHILTVDEKGRFSEDIALFTGMNYLKFSGSDQFGRNVTKTLIIIKS